MLNVSRSSKRFENHSTNNFVPLVMTRHKFSPEEKRRLGEGEPPSRTPPFGGLGIGGGCIRKDLMIIVCDVQYAVEYCCMEYSVPHVNRTLAALVISKKCIPISYNTNPLDWDLSRYPYRR